MIYFFAFLAVCGLAVSGLWLWAFSQLWKAQNEALDAIAAHLKAQTDIFTRDQALQHARVEAMRGGRERLRERLALKKG